MTIYLDDAQRFERDAASVPIADGDVLVISTHNPLTLRGSLAPRYSGNSHQRRVARRQARDLQIFNGGSNDLVFAVAKWPPRVRGAVVKPGESIWIAGRGHG